MLKRCTPPFLKLSVDGARQRPLNSWDGVVSNSMLLETCLPGSGLTASIAPLNSIAHDEERYATVVYIRPIKLHSRFVLGANSRGILRAGQSALAISLSPISAAMI